MRISLFLAAAFGLAASPVSVARAQQPSLVVLIAVDQLRSDYITHWSGQLTGGLARFWNDGAFYADGYQDHANTETAPGHASMLSGRFPYSTGILSNARGVETSTATLVDFPGTGASPFRFKGTTLADWMQVKDPSARVLSVSRKDRSAILPVAPGRSHTVLWYAPLAGSFTTSDWYASSLPEWVEEFNAEKGVIKLAGHAWNLLLPESAYPEPDSVEHEARTASVVFPHVLTVDTQTVKSASVYTPWMDSLTLALALRGVGAMQLGSDSRRTDLLSVSLSTTDAIGHRWGPDSRELHDQVLRVDRFLDAFIDSVIALRGKENVLFVLTSDHGVNSSPDIRSRFDENQEAVRVPSASFRPAVAEARAALTAAGLDTTAVRWEDLVLWVDRAKLGDSDFDVNAMMRSFAAVVADVPGVLRVSVIDELAANDTVNDVLSRRLVRMFEPGTEPYPGSKALLEVTLAPHNVIGLGDTGVHGTPHDYDARVPVAFMGPQFVPGRRAEKVNVVDIAPTLAAILGVTPLERLDGRILKEVIR